MLKRSKSLNLLVIKKAKIKTTRNKHKKISGYNHPSHVEICKSKEAQVR